MPFFQHLLYQLVSMLNSTASARVGVVDGSCSGRLTRILIRYGWDSAQSIVLLINRSPGSVNILTEIMRCLSVSVSYTFLFPPNFYSFSF